MGKCGYWRRLCFGTCLGYFPTERSLRPLRAAQDRSGPNAAPTYNPPQADQVLVTKNVLIEALCLPLLAVENDMIVSKNADLTVAYRVELPELFTMDAADYEAIHGN